MAGRDPLRRYGRASAANATGPALRVIHVAALGPSPRGALPGPLNVAMKQATELRKRGHSVEIFTTSATSKVHTSSTVATVEVHQFRRFMVPLMRRSGITSIPLINAVARRLRRTDIVHVHAGRDLVSIPVMILCRITNTPYVTQTHGMVRKSGHPLKRLVDHTLLIPSLAHAQHNYALQTSERRDLLSLGLAPSHIRVLPNGFSADGLPAWQPTSPPTVVFVARLHPEKRVMAFAAMAQLLVEGGIQATFHVIGQDQGDLERLKTFLNNNRGLAGRLSYDGERSHDEVVTALAGATVYVLPSDYDPFPMSLVEALAVGTPTVCTAACGIADLVTEGGAGIVAGSEPSALADAVRTVLGDVELQRRLSGAGRRLIAGRLSVESTVAQLEGDYLAAIAE